MYDRFLSFSMHQSNSKDFSPPKAIEEYHTSAYFPRSAVSSFGVSWYESKFISCAYLKSFISFFIRLHYDKFITFGSVGSIFPRIFLSFVLPFISIWSLWSPKHIFVLWIPCTLSFQLFFLWEWGFLVIHMSNMPKHSCYTIFLTMMVYF